MTTDPSSSSPSPRKRERSTSTGARLGSSTTITTSSTSTSLLKTATLAFIPAAGLFTMASAAAHFTAEGAVERTLVSTLAVCLSLAAVAYKDTLHAIFGGVNVKVSGKMIEGGATLSSLSSSSSAAVLTPERQREFNKFQRMFFVVNLVATFIDFIQGPYLYSVYKGYGYDMNDIAFLYLIGFASSALTSPAAGIFADTYGRRLGCMTFATLQTISCLLLHQNVFAILCLGRFLSGVATSFLSTCFECWMVSEHNRRGFPSTLLNSTFSTYIFLMGVVAVASGTIAGYAESQRGLLAPFDVCAATAALLVVLIPLLWREENYGDKKTPTSPPSFSSSSSITTNKKNNNSKIQEVLNVFLSGNKEVLYIGLTQATFEAAMFTWVFLWTPSLDTHQIPSLNLGLVFATFMIGVMCGSSTFRILTSSTYNQPPQKVLLGALLLGTASMVISCFPLRADWLLVAFVVFEACVGVYFSGMGSLRAQYIPEATRATVMNAIRLVLNLLIVVMYLGPVRVELGMEEKKPLVLGLCSLLLGLATVSHGQLVSKIEGDGSGGVGGGGIGGEWVDGGEEDALEAEAWNKAQ